MTVKSRLTHHVPPTLLVMGVSGCGKSTLGRALALALGAEFFDADDFHSVENTRKMAAGIPLTDADRDPWIATLAALLRKHADAKTPVVLACSALRERHRRILLDGLTGARIVHLHGSREALAARLAGRTGHFMPPDLLGSQLAALENPADAITIAIEDGTADQVRSVLAHLQATTNPSA